MPEEDRFKALLQRIVRVPKAAIDEQERLYQEQRKTKRKAKARAIVPKRRQAG